jgi:REP-associated tyrosine transposase
MARPKRSAYGGIVHHVFNRGSRKGLIFDSQLEYTAFLRLVAETRELRPMRIIAYCLMANHWHFLLWPVEDDELSRFMHRLTGTHAKIWRAERGTTGEGAVYQGRFGCVPILDSVHLLTEWRYIERNPVQAGLTSRAEDWRWSSARAHFAVNTDLRLDPGPFALPVNWLQFVNSEMELETFLYTSGAV